jgi:isopenicillin N synthase-like dioxygenase
MPVIDLDEIRNVGADGSLSARGREECRKVCDCLHKYGVLVVRDSRVSEDDNARFLDMMEQYFEQDDAAKRADARPELHYQVGSTPERTEKARDHCASTRRLPGKDRPVTLCPPAKDVKWRFFWRIGERPPETQFEELNAEPVVPAAFRERWGRDMDHWGGKLQRAVHDVAGAVAEGFGLERDFIQKMMRHGPHLLAPTGTDLNRFGEKDTVMAGYHSDLNFITCHGKSRFPGLYVWLRDGTKVAVKVPDGCLLMQAGKQLEWLTGGWCMAGFHEVVVSDKTLARIEERRARGKSLWRVSSTLFAHLRSDVWLEPIAQFNQRQKYPRKLVGHQVQEELAAINLAQK